MSEADLSCQELVELVTAYLDNGLPVEARSRFDAHLVLCGGCRNYVEQMRRTAQVTGRLTEESIAPVMRDELLVVFRKWKEEG